MSCLHVTIARGDVTRKSGVPQGRDNGLGKRLADAREAAKLSQQDVATEIVTAKRGRRTVNDWEAGRATPSLDDLRNLCRLYKISADRLLGLPEGTYAEQVRVIGRVINGEVDAAALDELSRLGLKPERAQEMLARLFPRKRATGG